MSITSQEKQDISELEKKKNYYDFPEIFKNLPEDRKTKAVSEFAIQCNPMALEFVPVNIRTSEMYINAVKKNGAVLKFIPPDKRTEGLCFLAVNKSRTTSQTIDLFQSIPPDKITENLYLLAVINISDKLEVINFLKSIPPDKRTEELYRLAISILPYINGYDTMENYKIKKLLEFIPSNIKTENFYSSLFRKKPDITNIPEIRTLITTYKLIVSVIMGYAEQNDSSSVSNAEEFFTFFYKITLSQYIYAVLKEANEEFNFNSLFDTPVVKSKIIDISNTTQYYTSFIEKLDYKPIDLKRNLNNFIWASEDIEQSLLHIFESPRSFSDINDDSDTIIQAYIARYNIENTRFINSQDFKNVQIFNDIINPKYLNLIIPVIALHIYMFQKNNPRVTDERMKTKSVISTVLKNNIYFERENNKYILIILNELNKFLSEDKKIYGYKNIFDQKEIALCNRTKIIDDSIKISKYLHIKFDNDYKEELKFPCAYSEYFKKVSSIDKKIVGYSLKSDMKKIFPKVTFTSTPELYRMYPIKPIMINHEDFDEAGKPIEHLFNKPIPDYFEKKYLKYKMKYLQLKKLNFGK